MALSHWRDKAVLASVCSALAMASAPAALAVPSQQAVLQAATGLIREGCAVALFPTPQSPQIGLSCNNAALAALLNPYFSESGFRIYSTGWSGETKIDWRLGPQEIRAINFRQGPHATARIANGTLFSYRNSLSPLDIRVRVGNPISSGVERVESIPGGLRFVIPFSRASLLCQGDPAGPGGWIDHACPDVNWNNPVIKINLRFSRDLTLRPDSNVDVSGSFDLGGIDALLPDRTIRGIARDAATEALRQITPTANANLSQFVKASVLARYAGMPANCIRLSYVNDNLRLSIPLDRQNAACARALGLSVLE